MSYSTSEAHAASVAERFARDTAHHKLTILHDDGLYRHLHFTSQPPAGQPRHSMYWFDLITVPGALIFQGDGESFVFRCATDMLGFFRDSAWKGQPNPIYWSEKLTDGRNRVMRYDRNLFEATVKEAFVEAVRSGGAPRGLGKAVREEILDSWEIDHEDSAHRVLSDFCYGGSFKAECVCGMDVHIRTSDASDAAFEGQMWLRRHQGPGHVAEVESVEPFRFYDTWEWSFREFDWWFLWSCRAILLGIAQYDATSAPEAVAAGV